VIYYVVNFLQFPRVTFSTFFTMSDALSSTSTPDLWLTAADAPSLNDFNAVLVMCDAAYRAPDKPSQSAILAILPPAIRSQVQLRLKHPHLLPVITPAPLGTAKATKKRRKTRLAPEKTAQYDLAFALRNTVESLSHDRETIQATGHPKGNRHFDDDAVLLAQANRAAAKVTSFILFFFVSDEIFSPCLMPPPNLSPCSFPLRLLIRTPTTPLSPLRMAPLG
jgi:hypothetical protein